MTKLRLLLAIVALPLVFAATAAATTVTHSIEQIDAGGLSLPLSNACGFPINRHAVGRVDFTDFLDDNGLIFKEIDHTKLTVTFTNPATGKTASTHRPVNHTTVGYDLFGPNEVVTSFAQTGSEFNITIPGLGLTIQVDGRIVRDGEGNIVFAAGPHDLIDGNTEAINAFCSYMADP